MHTSWCPSLLGPARLCLNCVLESTIVHCGTNMSSKNEDRKHCEFLPSHLQTNCLRLPGAPCTICARGGRWQAPRESKCTFCCLTSSTSVACAQKLACQASCRNFGRSMCPRRRVRTQSKCTWHLCFQCGTLRSMLKRNSPL